MHSDPLPPALPRLMPLPEATRHYGLSRSTIYRAAAEAKLKLLKMGSRTLVDVASAEAFVAALPQLVPARGRPRKDAA